MTFATPSQSGKAATGRDNLSHTSPVAASPLPIWNDGFGPRLTPLPGPVIALGVHRCAACPTVMTEDLLTQIAGIGACCWPCIELMREADAG